MDGPGDGSIYRCKVTTNPSAADQLGDRWILSLDGGGVRGLMTAVFLARLEEEAGLTLANCFDLIAGTSSGSIIAGGMAIGPDGTAIVEMTELISFFRKASPEIFRGPASGLRGTLRWLRGPLYEIVRLRSALAGRAGILKLSDVRSRLLVTAYDMRRGEPVIFQSWLAGGADSEAKSARAEGRGLIQFCPTLRDNDGRGLDDFDLVTALSASAAVPTYFAPVRHPRGDGDHYALVDGFVFASNPVLPAYFAARRLYGRRPRFHILSIGTGKATARYDWSDLKNRGALGWLKPVIEAFPDGVNDASASYMDWMSDIADIEHIRINADFEGVANPPSPGFDDASDRNLDALTKAGQKLYDDNRARIARLVEQLRQHAAARGFPFQSSGSGKTDGFPSQTRSGDV